MQLLKDVAQQARYQAMQPGQVTRHFRDQDADLQAFERAVEYANQARYWRAAKDHPHPVISTGKCEVHARAYERRVREIALQSEIYLQRRHEAAQADQAMLGILLGVAS